MEQDNQPDISFASMSLQEFSETYIEAFEKRYFAKAIKRFADSLGVIWLRYDFEAFDGTIWSEYEKTEENVRDHPDFEPEFVVILDPFCGFTRDSVAKEGNSG